MCYIVGELHLKGLHMLGKQSTAAVDMKGHEKIRDAHQKIWIELPKAQAFI